MRKYILFILFALNGAINAFAENQNTVQQSVIDSLSLELKTLKHDFEFLFCEKSLDDYKHDLDCFKNNIDVSSNSILINVFHGEFNSDLYSSYKESYSSSNTYLETVKESVKKIKLLVYLKMENPEYGFTESEIKVLESKMNILSKSINSIEAGLRYQKTAIEMYLIK